MNYFSAKDKFKIGDKVKISNPLDVSFNHKNEIHKIIDFIDDGYYAVLDVDTDDKWCKFYASYELELVNDNNYSFAFKCPTGESGELGICETKENEENGDMNKVLELWYTRKINKINKKYEKLKEEFTEKQYSVVESFKELVENFENDLKDLYDFDKVTEQFVLKEVASTNQYKYDIDWDRIQDKFLEKYYIERNEEINKIGDIKEEVEAQLSLSSDLAYQQEVLERYGIITNKTKKISE